MKKFLTLLFVGTVLAMTIGKAFAENYNYKLYDPTTHKTYSTILTTLNFPDDARNVYRLGLIPVSLPSNSKIIICNVDINQVKDSSQQGLLGGNCIGVDNDNPGHVYNWREYRPGTFKREVMSIIVERGKEGRNLYGMNYKSNNSSRQPSGTLRPEFAKFIGVY